MLGACTLASRVTIACLEVDRECARREDSYKPLSLSSRIVMAGPVDTSPDLCFEVRAD
jgi:hypothetical protein